MLILKKIYRNIFFNKEGKLVIIQWPNLSLFLWFITMIISNLLKEGEIKSIVSWISLVSIIIWSILEIIFGVNYFRRCLGLLILAMIIVTRLIT